jgi:hypothetical protein
MNPTKSVIICGLTVLLACSAHAGEVTIVDAKATKTGDTWTIAVTLNHPGEDGPHRADLWRVVAEDGTVLGTRNLGHAHDQPFTRDLEGVKIPAGTSIVYIEAQAKPPEDLSNVIKIIQNHKETTP